VRVDIVVAGVAILSLLFGVFSYFHQRSERRRYEQTVEDIRQRGNVVNKLSGFLREIQHCTDEPGGLARHKEPLERRYWEARQFARLHDRLLGEDVIAIVQDETDLARQVFEKQIHGDADVRLEHDRLRNLRAERDALLRRLNSCTDFPPAPGSLMPLTQRNGQDKAPSAASTDDLGRREG
jgi:hypothetical protein